MKSEKDNIRKQLMENERVMQSRMAHLKEEKDAIEVKVYDACVRIQSVVRMRI